MINGVAQMAYAGDKPWHGLGVEVRNDLTPEQMMKKAGLDWTVHEVESYVDYDGEKIATGQKSLIRSMDKKVLTNVGEGWNPVQNSEAFEFFHEYVMAGDMDMEVAGSLKEGRNVFVLAKVKESFSVNCDDRVDNYLLFSNPHEYVMAGDMDMEVAGSLKEGRNVFVLAKVKESFSVNGDDQVDNYLLFSNPHEYGKAIDIRMTPVRVVCNNTLTFSLQSGSKNFVKLNHRSKFDPVMVKQQMGLASEKFSQYKEMAEFLSSRRYNKESLMNFYNEIFPHTYSKGKSVETVEDLTKNAKSAMDVLYTQPGANYAEGSWWQALNSVTYLTDHKMGRSADSRMQSAWFGQNQSRKVKAVNKAVEYATAA